jgi:ubiquinone/menaquinone biosynthesis C-methylase UbiE
MAEKTDWAYERHRKMIVDQRRFLWREDTISMLAGWIGIRPGISVLDAGCGRGYLGEVFWPHFGRGSLYVGVDCSASLLEEAREISGGWARGGRARFALGDACALPFPDGTFDWTCCQTLLMHLADPGLVLGEMIRVTKPGGVVSCNEPDNEVALASHPFDSLPDMSFEDLVLVAKVNRHWISGRIALGMGDWRIGPRVPSMMRELGLVDIDIRVNDLVELLQPPYETPRMQFRLEMMKENMAAERRLRRRGVADPLDEEHRRFFLAGGGTPYIYGKYLAMKRRIHRKTAGMMRRQLEEGTYSICPIACSFFCIMGRKP